MTLLHPMFPPPRVRPARAIPIFELTPGQLEALTDLHRLRKEAEREVERLIAFLDMVDGYSMTELDMAVDDEPLPLEDRENEDGGESEPTLASPEDIATIVTPYDADDRELDTADEEPSLGWSTTMAFGNGDDLEQNIGECDFEIESDLEPIGDDEPSLGSLNVFDQSGIYAGSLEDLERGTTRRLVGRGRSCALVPLMQFPVLGPASIERLLTRARAASSDVTLI